MIKIHLRNKKGIVFKLYLVVLLFLIPIKTLAQYDLFPPKIESTLYHGLKPELLKKYRNNKKIPESIELQTLIVLTKYPELKNVRIEMKYKKIGTTLACRPSLSSIFKSKTKRKYNVFVNNSHNNKSIQIENFSFNAQIGIISHEMAHITDYLNKSNFQLLGMGFKYTSSNWRRKLERSVDSIAISRGFGWQLYEFSQQVQNCADIPVTYKNYKLQTYYKPSEIMEKINDALTKQWPFYLKLPFFIW